MRSESIIPLLLVSLGFASSCLSQLPDVDDRRLGVDCLKLISGERVYGFSLSEFSLSEFSPSEISLREQSRSRSTDASLRFAVERQWLEKTHPDLFERATDQEAAKYEKVRVELLERIDDWLAERSEAVDQALRQFLQVERSRLAAADPSPAQRSLFMVLMVPRAQVRELTLAKPQLRHIAGIAYHHDIENIVRTPATLLLKRMQELGIDPSAEAVDLSHKLPAMLGRSDRQWATRQALVEFQMRKPLEYQGTGATFLRRTENANAAQADIDSLVGQLMSSSSSDAISQLGAELGLPEFRNLRSENAHWWKKISQEAEAEGFRGVLVSRLKQNLLSPQVTVETSFLVRESEGNWFIALEFASTADANQQPADRTERIKDDPQIQSIVNALKALGLDASDRLEQALRHGAATEFAMNQATGQFFTLLSKHIKHLDHPEIVLAD